MPRYSIEVTSSIEPFSLAVGDTVVIDMERHWTTNLIGDCESENAEELPRPITLAEVSGFSRKVSHVQLRTREDRYLIVTALREGPPINARVSAFYSKQGERVYMDRQRNEWVLRSPIQFDLTVGERTSRTSDSAPRPGSVWLDRVTYSPANYQLGDTVTVWVEAYNQQTGEALTGGQYEWSLYSGSALIAPQINAIDRIPYTWMADDTLKFVVPRLINGAESFAFGIVKPVGQPDGLVFKVLNGS